MDRSAPENCKLRTRARETSRRHLTPVRQTSEQDGLTTKGWEGCREAGRLVPCWGGVNPVWPFWRGNERITIREMQQMRALDPQPSLHWAVRKHA